MFLEWLWSLCYATVMSLNCLRDKLYWVLSCINSNESTLCVHVLLYVNGLTSTRQTIVGFLVAVDIHMDMMTRVWKKNKIKYYKYTYRHLCSSSKLCVISRL